MSNVISFRGNVFSGWTHEIPEESVLLMLCTYHTVRIFEIEHEDRGEKMMLAHFDYKGMHYIYQGGQGALTSHLFFYLISWADNTTPQDMALEFFPGSILSDYGNNTSS